MRYLIAISILAAMLLFSCGETPPTTPEPPAPKVWTGSLIVNARFDSSMIGPISVGVILDGDSIGYTSILDTIKGIIEGQHRVTTYHDDGDIVWRSITKSVFIEHDEITRVSFSLVESGILIIKANSVNEFDSIRVKLDSDTLDIAANPLILDGVTQGSHKLVVFAQNIEQYLEGWVSNIQVIAAETTEVNISLVQVGSTISGLHAPDISCIDLDGEEWSLSDHWGEVIYLYFFEHT